MKKLLLILLPLAVVCGCGKINLSDENNNNSYEPDIDPDEDIFLQFCIEKFDTDGDGVISQYEADKITSINCADMEIVRLTNIDKFSNLATLDCSGNKLASLDLSKNRHLTGVNCKRNSLRSLSVAGCKELRTLDCSYNSLTSLDLSSATALQSVDCSNNSLATLNVGGCTALRTLDCSYNKLTTLDLSKTTGIVTLTCKRNSLKSLILTDCAELVSLDCSYNSLTTLDVSYCLKLSSLNCTDNPSLKELLLFSPGQKISDLDKDGNTNIKYYLSETGVGAKYSRNGKEGIVFYITSDGRHGKIVSEDKTNCAWSTENISTGATDENDGMANMKTIQAISGWREKYPAFAWCADKGDGWYLPAKNELITLYESRIINTNDYYWSSTENNRIYVWIVYMSSGRTYINYKDNDYYMRAVSAF